MGYDRYDNGGRDFRSGQERDYGRGDHGRRGSRGERSYRGNYDQGGDERGFADRATDEVRSWFGDADAERRRERDAGTEPSRSAYNRDRYRSSGRDDDRERYGRRDERGESFFERAGQQVSSWFGNDDDDRVTRGRYDYDDRGQEYRRNAGLAYGGAAAYGASRAGRSQFDHGYENWRTRQIEALDREYEEYRREHQEHFDNHFSNWRSSRQSQRQLLAQVQEHAEVLGSDGAHVGTVDKVRGDQIILTKNDQDAGGRHHAVPVAWLQAVEGGKVMLNKSADEAKRQWRDAEQNQAMFGQERRDGERDRDGGPHMLNRSFSGTY